MSTWNLNRALIMLGALFTLLGLLTAFAWDVKQVFGAMGAPFLVGVVAALVLAFWARPWLYLVTGILLAAFPLVVLFVFGAYAGIVHPGSGPEGIGLLLLLLGALLGLLGGVMGFIQGRKNAQPPVAAYHTAWPGVIALILIALVAGLALSGAWAGRDYRQLASFPTSHVESPEANATLFLSGTQFAPRDLALPVGKLVALKLDNRDKVTHTFSYTDAAGQEHTTVMPGRTVTTVYFKFDTPQTIHFWCAPHSGGHDDMDPASMWGTMTVA